MDQFVISTITRLEEFPVWGLGIFSFLSACIQQVFPPYPSEVLLLVLGALSGRGVLSGPFSIVPYLTGTVVSSLLLFRFSQRLGTPILANRYVRRIFPRRSQRHAALYVRRYGPAALAVCKFLPGVNTVCIIVGGAMGLSGAPPLLSIAFAGIAENAVYFVAGFFIGDNMAALSNFARQFTAAAVAAMVLLALLCFFFKFHRRLRKWLRNRRRQK